MYLTPSTSFRLQLATKSLRAVLQTLDQILADIGLCSDDRLGNSTWQRADQQCCYHRDVRPATQSWSRNARRRAARGRSQQDIDTRSPPLFIARLFVQDTVAIVRLEDSRGRSPERNAGHRDRGHVQVSLDWYSGPSRTLVQTFWEYLSRKLKDSDTASTSGQVL
jgi:hypothetical protein